MNDDDCIILASSSPRRRDLLSLLGIPLRVEPGEVDEEPRSGESPEACVRRLSLEKASLAAAREKDRWVLGADTVVLLDGEIIGKPRSGADAVSILGKLSGRTHTVISGVSLVRSGAGYSRTEVERTLVVFRKFSEAEAAAYVSTGEPLDKAGAYGAQGTGTLLIERVNGSYSNVVGLPLGLVLRMFFDAGMIAVSKTPGRMYDLL
jgi:septum formation protein